MALRMHFEPADLTRVSVTTRTDELWEVLLAAHLLQTDDGKARFGAWRASARRLLPAAARPLLTLAPPRGYSPDFLTAPEAPEGLDAGLDALAALPETRLRTELSLLPAPRRELRWVTELAEGRAADRRRLVNAVRGFHRLLVAPHRRYLDHRLALAREGYVDALLSGGTDRLLTGLHPTVRWNPPVLTLTHFSGDRDVRLAGRGLLIIPSFFCWRTPTVLRDPTLRPVLVCPMTGAGPAHPAPVMGGRHEGGSSIADLIGGTRATILQAAAEGCHTTEVARRLRKSPATVSAHLRVLRDAGMVVSQRRGGSVVHTLSARGHALLGAPS